MSEFNDDDIPELRPPDEMPPVHTQTDLYRHWRALMGELGFSRARLYVQLVLPDGSVDAPLLEVDELPEVPDTSAADDFVSCFGRILDEVVPDDSRLAVLYARPGRRGPNTADRAWAGALTAAAERAGVPLLPVHVANDDEVRVMAPDDLAEPA